MYDTLWPKKLIWSTLWHTIQKNFYYDPLCHTMTQKICIMIHSMTHYDQKNYNMTHYYTLWPKNVYYDPLWPTMTKKISNMIHSMTHYDQKKL